MATRYHPLGKGSIVTSPFGPRSGGFHFGVDFGFPGGSSNRPVYAIQSGTVIFAGPAQGYGGPDPAGWLVIDSDDTEGGGCLEYGHIVRRCNKGDHVKAGQLIAIINPSSATNGGTAPHLHLSDMPGGYDPGAKQDPMPRLRGALDPITSTDPARNPVLLPPITPGDPMKPDFNEYSMWSPNKSSRGGRKVDLFLLHTQEGNGNADSLARFLQGNNVSYHYTISEDLNDHGVTVVDVVDTDNASWSVLSANPRSINLCFAGSRAAWTRAEWLKQSRAIDVAAYLAVQDCKKYGIPTKVLAPPYNSDPPGISDHKYVTQWLKDGSHTDVGNSFPWDVFTAAVNKYAGTAPAQPGGLNMTPDQVKKLLEDVAYIKDQLGPGFDEWGEDGDLGRNAKGQRRTFRAGLAALMRKVGA